MLVSRYPLVAPRLRRYFYSGWAFLMPYLFVYLLYYVTKWPVNPTSVGARIHEPGASNIPPASNGWVPCMLHVYLALHAIHVVLAGFALWSWWRAKTKEIGVRSQESGDNHATETRPLTSDCRPAISPSSLPATRYSLLTALAPWALLALIFYIPGVYLEWPSDPWEHLRRINEWRILDTVGAHSSWLKSSYFIPYSLLSWCIGLRQLFWLDFYYTGICLLLCWQYYRFSRACGLGERASMVFVIIQALLFGNNIFSFYRYYGISSSIYAQLGAVALTRIVLEFAARGTKLGTDLSHGGHGAPTQSPQSQTGGEPSLSFVQENDPVGPQLACAPLSGPGTDARSDPTLRPSLPPAPPLAHNAGLRDLCVRALCSLWRTSETDHSVTGFWSLSSVFWLLTPGSCLLLLTAFNHVQGLGIAALGIAAVTIWRLIERKLSALWWLIGGTLVVNALFLWLYPRPAIIETYRAQGYLNAWYGFNILDLTSPAGDRTLQILSAFGLVSIITAIPLLRWNHVIAWLTILPLFIFSLPCPSILFSETLYKSGETTAIIAFHRLFFAIPSGLAVVMMGWRWPHHWRLKSEIRGPRALIISGSWLNSAIPLFALAASVTLPAGGLGFNRTWQALATVPNDLQMKSAISVANLKAESVRAVEHSRPVGSRSVASVLNAFRPRDLPFVFLRIIGEPNVEAIKDNIPLLLFCNPTTATATPTLTRDPLVTNPTAWNTFGGPPVEFVSGIQNLSGSSTALQNPPGQHCDVFTSDLMPIDSEQSYRVEWSAIQRGSTNGTAYLAVAWYTADGLLLASNVAAPIGAGNPPGWINGTYSYFGLVGDRVPAVWTTYRTAFGPDTSAAIPSKAKFVRIGALLNYNSAPNASIQLTDIRLWRKSRGEVMPDRVSPIDAPLLVVAPSNLMLWTFASQASQASSHWPAQEVASSLGGCPELLSAVRLAGGASVGNSEIIYNVPPLGGQLRYNIH